MENKINIAELLKDCPYGMELDCTMFDNVTFICVDNTRKHFPIEILVGGLHTKYLTKEGCYHNNTLIQEAKCVIFPKGKTTWEGFQRHFKDGDIVSATMYPEGTWIGIFKQYEKNFFESHCSINACGEFRNSGIKNHSLTGIHLASENEKQKLFDAIKSNGYKWNDETKTLDKLCEPRFKVGDRIKYIESTEYVGIITEITPDDFYKVKCRNGEKYINISIQDRYELLMPKFKVGDRVKHISAYASGIVEKVSDKGYYINYPKGEGVCYISFTLEKDYELAPNKFDISTLKPFDKVLVRHHNEQKWDISFFSHCNGQEKYKYSCINGFVYAQCILYEGNEHLLDTTNNCDEFYKTW